MINVMEEFKSVDDSFRSNDLKTSLEKLESLWGKIPEPKPATSNAFLVIEYAVAIALKVGDLDAAQKWASQAPSFAEKRHDMGEVEFLIGKVAFERGETDVAKRNFELTNLKSEGRIFEGEDSKFRALIQ